MAGQQPVEGNPIRAEPAAFRELFPQHRAGVAPYWGGSGAPVTSQQGGFHAPNAAYLPGSNAFITAVMSGTASFNQTYALLQQSMTLQQNVYRGLDLGSAPATDLYLSRTSSPMIYTGSCSPMMYTGSSSPIMRSWDRISPQTTTRRRLADDMEVEPLKLGRLGVKRQRSQTIVEAPFDLSDADEDDFISPPSTPSVLHAYQLSPLNKSRALPSRIVLSDKSPRQVKHGLGGERRLTIQFTNNGRLEDPIQTFGKYRLIIRNGLSGTHTMYAQPWRFEIKALEGCLPGNAGEVRLRWTVTNELSSRTISYLETPDQARERQVKGNTICNNVVREALTRRAEELEAEIQALGHGSTRAANLRSLVKELRPKQCTEGLLFFGLRHQIAQRKSAD